jgi:hypothetical protein
LFLSLVLFFFQSCFVSYFLLFFLSLIVSFFVSFFLSEKRDGVQKLQDKQYVTKGDLYLSLI